jgi:3,4-dihydroxy 2-butanone 4-phosphate synthase/GTP cyclohydrolase II
VLKENAISSIEEIIESARQGAPFILVDADDRENEGDLIIPAQYATPSQINFMVRHARGLVCLAISNEWARHLKLPPMTSDNRAAHGTAFTVSIEAKEGVTTGISAHDRAHTIAVAINPSCGPDDLVSPGHIFPLVARDGGVLVRAGHTEAAVDIARLAGLQAAGVICEIMNDDGSMARLADLVKFSQTHCLKIGTVSDLIAYRRRNERCIERVLDREFESIYGRDLRLLVFRNTIDNKEHLVIVKGVIAPPEVTLVRMHNVDLAVDMLGPIQGRRDYVPAALRAIRDFNGPGVAVFLQDSNPASMSQRYSGEHVDSVRHSAIRDYGIGAQILHDLGVRKIALLTSSSAKLSALEGYDLEIVDRISIQ